MKHLQNFQEKQEETIQLVLSKAIVIAFERTKTDPFDITLMIEDILSEFPKINEEEFKEAIRNGGLAKYGKCFKLSTNEVCYWIREFIKEKNKKNIYL